MDPPLDLDPGLCMSGNVPHVAIHNENDQIVHLEISLYLSLFKQKTNKWVS